MMSPKAIAALVLEMKVPHEIQNDYCRVKWMLEQAATIAMKVSIDEMVKSVSTMIGGREMSSKTNDTPICYRKQSSVVNDETKRIKEWERTHDKVYDLNMQMCDIAKTRRNNYEILDSKRPRHKKH